MIALDCPQCRRGLSIPDAAAIAVVVCTACGATFAAGIPVAEPGAEWLAAPAEREVDSMPLPLRFQNQQRATSRGIGLFPAMALLFALIVPFGIGAVLFTAMQKPPATPTSAASEEAESIDPSQAGERKPGGAAPIVEYKSLTEDPALIESSSLETGLPPPKAEPAPPLFRGAKPNPKPRPEDRASTPKPPPP